MRARRICESVSPPNDNRDDFDVMVNGADGDADEGIEGMMNEMGGSPCEKISLQREEDVIRDLRDPKLPSREEIEKHNLTHLPFRDWCPICVKAKGREMDHKRDNGKERKLPEYSWDYCFPGAELGFRWTVLVGKERQTKARMATTVPMKGTSGKFGVDKCWNSLRRMEIGTIIFW